MNAIAGAWDSNASHEKKTDSTAEPMHPPLYRPHPKCAALVDALVEAGYTNAVAVEGGYSTWMSKYTPFGRKVPPKGKFVSTGREALKSGLDLDPTVASAYEENWGRQDYKP